MRKPVIIEDIVLSIYTVDLSLFILLRRNEHNVHAKPIVIPTMNTLSIYLHWWRKTNTIFWQIQTYGLTLRAIFLSLLHSGRLLYRLNAISIFCQRLRRLPPISNSKNFVPFVCCFANYFAFYILPQLIWMFLSINANINLHPWSAPNQYILSVLKLFNQNIFVISNLVILNECMRWLYGGETDCAMHIEIIV